MNSIKKIGRTACRCINALLLVLTVAAMGYGQGVTVSDDIPLPAGQAETEGFHPWHQDPDPDQDDPPVSGISCAVPGAQGKAPLWQVQIDRIDTIGAVEFNREFSSQRTVGEVFQAVADAVSFSADSGRTEILSVAVSKQAPGGTKYRATVLAGFDPLGSRGLLKGAGTTSNQVCSENYGWAAEVGFGTVMAAGRIVSKVRADPQSLERYFNSDSFGRIDLNSSAAFGSENSQQSYSQTISVNGDNRVSQTTHVSFGNAFSDICPWQMNP